MKRRAFRPTRQQKQLMSALGMDSTAWLVMKGGNDHVIFVHRHTGTYKKYFYGGESR